MKRKPKTRGKNKLKEKIRHLEGQILLQQVFTSAALDRAINAERRLSSVSAERDNLVRGLREREDKIRLAGGRENAGPWWDMLLEWAHHAAEEQNKFRYRYRLSELEAPTPTMRHEDIQSELYLGGRCGKLVTITPFQVLGLEYRLAQAERKVAVAEHITGFSL